MADITKTVEIIFAGDDQISSTVRDINSKMTDLTTVVGTAVTPLADFAGGVEAADIALAAMATGSMVAAVNAAKDFQTQFGEIQTLLGDLSGDDGAMQKFNQDILDYATTSTQSISDINRAVYDAISAGTDYDKVLDLLNDAEKLSVAGRADLDTVTKALVSTLNAYGASTDDANTYSDILFTTVKDGQTTVSELADGLSRVTGLASSAGVPFSDLSAALAALTAAGLPTSEAITALKAAISNIIDPSTQASKTADDLGVEFDAAALSSEGLQGVLWDVYKATGGNVEQMSKLFGSTDALNGALILGADKAGVFKQALDDMANSSGAVDTAYKTMVDNLDIKTQQLKNSVNVVLIEIGENLLPGVTGSAESLSDVFAGLKVALDEGAFDPVFAALDDFLTSFNEYMGGVADALPEALDGVDWQPMLDAIGDVGVEIQDAFEAIFGDIDLTDPQDLEDLIQKLVDGIGNLAEVTAGIIDSWEPFLSGIGSAIDGFTDLSPEAARSAGEVAGFGQAIDKVLDFAGDFINAIGTIAGSLAVIAVSTAADAILSLGAAVMGSIGGMSSFSEAILAAIGSASGTTLVGILGLTMAATYLIDKFIGPGQLSATIDHMIDKVTDLDWWIDKATGAIQAQKDALQAEKDQADKLNEKFGDMNEALKDLSAKEKLDFAFTVQEEGLTIDDIVEKYDQLPEEMKVKFEAFIDEKDFEGAVEYLEQVVPDEKDIAITVKDADDLADQLRGIGLQVQDLPDEKFIDVITSLDENKYDYVRQLLADIPAEQEIDFLTNANHVDDDVVSLMKHIGDLPAEKQTEIIAAIKDDDVEQAKKILDESFPDKKQTNIQPKLDQQSADKAKQEMDKIFLEKYKIEAEIEIANLESEAKKVEAAFDAMADISVAQIEADAQRVSAAFTSMGVSVSQTTDLIGDLVNAMVGTDDPGEQYFIQQLIEDQIQLEKDSLALQEDLVRAQIAYMDAKTQALQSGDALIKIEADGMEPEIEAFMWRILEKIQMRAAEEQAEFLLGIGAPPPADQGA